MTFGFQPPEPAAARTTGNGKSPGVPPAATPPPAPKARRAPGPAWSPGEFQITLRDGRWAKVPGHLAVALEGLAERDNALADRVSEAVSAALGQVQADLAAADARMAAALRGQFDAALATKDKEISELRAQLARLERQADNDGLLDSLVALSSRVGLLEARLDGATVPQGGSKRIERDRRGQIVRIVEE